jgi:hypothetical protein
MSQGLYIYIKIKMMLNGFVVVCDYATKLKKKNVRRDIFNIPTVGAKKKPGTVRIKLTHF